jgi:hypothetical protein
MQETLKDPNETIRTIDFLILPVETLITALETNQFVWMLVNFRKDVR